MKLRTILPVLLTGLILATSFQAEAQKSKKKKGKKAAATSLTLNNDMDSISYALGLSIAESLTQIKGSSIKDMNMDAMSLALRQVAKGDSTFMDLNQAKAYLDQWFANQVNDEAATNLQKGQAYLADNKKNDGVVETKSGLQYMVIKSGEGPSPTLQDEVTVHYTGTLIDGTIFDSSVKRGEPATFPLNGVIVGWQEGVALMNVGAKYKFWIPAELAYGASARSPGGPNNMLIFEVELLKIN